MKKLLNKRGSVLFLVVVVMALLLVAASATYYVVRNQHMSATTHYSSEQSYQTALSVSQNVSQYIDGVVHKIQTGDLTYDSVNIVQSMVGLSKNSSLNATPTDMTAEGLGQFNVEIVKVDESGDSHTFDIITTAEVNGESVRLVMRKIIILSAAETKYFTRFLTSTGRGTAEDTILSAGDIFGVSYFENDYTRFTQGNTKIRKSIYATGTLDDFGVNYKELDLTDYSEVITGGNFTISTTDGSAVMTKCVYVGGDMYVEKGVEAEEVFVLGNLTINHTQSSDDPPAVRANTIYHVKGDCYLWDGTSKNTIYVGGDLYLGDNDPNNSKQWYNTGTVYVGGSVYVRNQGSIGGFISYDDAFDDSQCPSLDYSNLQKDGNPLYAADKDKNGNAIDVDQVILSAIKEGYSYNNNNELDSWDNIENYIYNSVAMGIYNQWDAETYFEKEFPIAYANDPVNLSALAWDTPDDQKDRLQQSWTELTTTGNITQPGTGNVIGKFEQYDNPWTYYAEITESCKLAPVFGWGRGYSVLVLDATDHDLYIYLDADGYTVDGKKTFMFSNALGFNILIKGTHSVIFILPEDTNYKHATQMFIGHLGLAAYLQGRSSGNTYVDGRDLLGAQLFGTVSNDSSEEIFETILSDIEYGDDGTYLSAVNKDVSQFNGAVVHNNIFFVTKGDSTILDFNVQSCFCGYIYSPNLTLDCDGSYGGLQFFGGLIVGAYTYTNPSAILVFAAPYDPYNGHGCNIVTDLMSENNKYNSNPSNPAAPSGGGVVLESHNIGYR